MTAVSLAGACLAGALAVAGCGSAGSVVDPVARAADVSNQVPGMRMQMAMQFSSAALPTPILATGQGSFRTTDHSGSFSLAMHLPDLPQVTQALGSSTLQLTEVVKGTTVYIKLPAALARQSSAANKPWLKIDLAQAASAAGIPGLSTLASNPASSDPSQFLRYLHATSGGVTKVGTATVDGFQTTHYRARIQLDRVPDGFPAASRPQVRQAVAAIERLAHLKALPVDVWIDGNRLVRRMRFVLQETVAGQTIGSTITIDVPQYGPQPAPALPPSSQVTEIGTPALGSGTGGATSP